MLAHSFRSSLIRFVVVVSVFSVSTPSLGAAALPSGFTESQVAGGLSEVMAMDFAPDGRLFVCEKAGRLRVIENGILAETPFFVVPNVDSTTASSSGLLGVTFDPDFLNNGFFYVHYTAASPTHHNRVSRFTVTNGVVDPSSVVTLLELDDLGVGATHFGGSLHFGVDGKLYISTGDYGRGEATAQSLTSLGGKILRINRDGSIPSDNPFYNAVTDNYRAIWALGFRNPFTFAIQPGMNRIFINDMGEGAWDEINDGIPGSNYGWPGTEGPTTNPLHQNPWLALQYSVDAYAVTGGTFYNPPTNQFPSEYVGTYFFVDYVFNSIRRIDPSNPNPNPSNIIGFATDIASKPLDIDVASDGTLYYLSRGETDETTGLTNNGSVHKIRYSSAPVNQMPVANVGGPYSGTTGQTVQFNGSASSDPDGMVVAYDWNFGDGTSGTGATPTHVYSSAGSYVVTLIVTDDAGATNSQSATTTITVSPPAAPSGLTASSKRKGEVILQWVDESNNEQQFWIERSTSPSINFVRIATLTANITTYKDRRLMSGSTYSYRVRAVNNGGNSVSDPPVSILVR